MTQVRDKIMEQPVEDRLEYAIGLLEMLMPGRNDERVTYLKGVHGLTPAEAKLLVILHENAGRCVSVASLHAAMYINDADAPEFKIVTVLICKIRAKCGDEIDIENVWGHGYKLNTALEFPSVDLEPSEVTVDPTVAAKHNTPWSDQDDDDLRQMVMRGDTWGTIAYELERTVRGCVERWQNHVKGREHAETN